MIILFQLNLGFQGNVISNGFSRRYTIPKLSWAHHSLVSNIKSSIKSKTDFGNYISF